MPHVILPRNAGFYILFTLKFINFIFFFIQHVEISFYIKQILQIDLSQNKQSKAALQYEC